jgi:hypothetical protein
LAALAAVCCAVAARPQHRDSDPTAWIDRGADLLAPDGVIIVLDRFAEQRLTPAGEMAVATLERSGVLDPNGRLGEAWSHVARAIKTPPDRAFDVLLGRRAVFVASGGAAFPWSGDWSLATRVSRADAERLLDGLHASQRALLAGRAVFSVERGAYRLCVLDGAGTTDRLLVLAPSEGRSFERLVGSIAGDEAWRWVIAPTPINGGVLARFPVAAGAGELLVAARAEGDTWIGSAVAEQAITAGAAWSDRAAAELTNRGALAMLGAIDAETVAGSPIAPALGLTTERVRGVLGTGARRSLVRLDVDDDGAAVIEAAIETLPGMHAEADAIVRDTIALISADPAAAPDFQGRAPEAVRTAPLRGGFAERMGDTLIRGKPSIAWGYAADPSWMALALGGSSPEARVRPLLADVAAAPGQDVASAGRLRPLPVAELLERAVGLDRPVLGWTELIAEVRWTTRTIGEDRIKADFRVQMHAAE